MGIVVIRQDGRINQWKESLLKGNPDIPVFSYLEDHPKEEILMAVVWKHPQGILTNYPNLKCIASFGAGVDFIFDDVQRPKKVPITRVVDPKLAGDMSEFVLGQILGYLKNFNRYKIDQVQGNWEPLGYKRIEDISVGIMGMGALGMELAGDLKKLDFKVLGWANSNKENTQVPIYIGQKQRNEFLSKVNVLVCLLPLTPETKGILNEELFLNLPRGSYVINVARGGHLVDADLIKLLDSGHLSGASLDVFHSEPLPKNHPFWTHSLVHITPHIASVSDIPSVTPQILENYNRLVAGQPLKNLVSNTKGY